MGSAQYCLRAKRLYAICPYTTPCGARVKQGSGLSENAWRGQRHPRLSDLQRFDRSGAARSPMPTVWATVKIHVLATVSAPALRAAQAAPMRVMQVADNRSPSSSFAAYNTTPASPTARAARWLLSRRGVIEGAVVRHRPWRPGGHAPAAPGMASASGRFGPLSVTRRAGG